MVNHIEIIIEIIVHATEDTKKIFEPILELFDIKEEEFVKERLEGHFGNPILLIKAKLGKKRAEEFIKKLVSKISKSQMNEFLQNIEMYFEGSSLFMRISKGDLVRRSISLQQSDALKIKISTPVYKKNELVRTYLDLLGK
ncbi:MAG: exosome protein [Thaumarchaeota archaeon]|nr:MAG: exosome protein [Nitrososphaerota archaeon]TLX83306.1 MAG: exosome protein [Nitrososphaerota archaeon]